MRKFIGSRLSHSPSFTRKIVNVPFRIDHPVWVDDPDFDLAAHIHRIGCPAPDGPPELAGEIAGIPLDRNRPLWDMWFVEGLEHGYVGLVAKMHHATIDGVSGANLMMHLFDLEPEPVESAESATETPAPAERRPSDVELFARRLLARARRPLLIAANLAGTARGLVNLAVRRGRGSSAMATPFTAPATPFNRAITPIAAWPTPGSRWSGSGRQGRRGHHRQRCCPTPHRHRGDPMAGQARRPSGPPSDRGCARLDAR